MVFGRGSARGSPSRYCMEYLRRRAGGGAVLSGFCRRLIVTYAAFAVLEPEAVAVELEDVNVVSKAIEQRASGALGGEHAGPLVEGQVAGDDNRAALVALAEDLEQQLGPRHAHYVSRTEGHDSDRR